MNDIDEITIINYIKRKYPRIIFKHGSNNSIGFIVLNNKIVGYITGNGEINKLKNPIEITDDMLNNLPLVTSINEDNKNLLENVENINDRMLNINEFKNEKYDVLVDEKNKELLFIKKEYTNKLNEIIIEHKNELSKLEEHIINCKNKLLNEKQLIINAIKEYKTQITNYIKDIVNNKESNDYDKLNEMYVKLLKDKNDIENSMIILITKEKEKNKSTEGHVDELNNTIKIIQDELNKIKSSFSEKELENVMKNEYNKNCIQVILNQKSSIIEEIKDYKNKWIEWVDNNNINIESQKDKLKNELEIIYSNLKNVANAKNEYIEKLNLSINDKNVLINKLNTNISDIKTEVNKSLNEQIYKLSIKNEELLKMNIEKDETLKNKERIINEMMIQLDHVKQLLEKNNSNVVQDKSIDIDNCYITLQKFMNVNNMFYRKKQVISILDKIIKDNVKFSNLSDIMKENMIKKFEKVKIEINKHIDFLDLNKYINSPIIKLFKSKSTIKNIPIEFCEELNNISSYWTNNIGIFREQDHILTNIYEDLSGAVRVYIKIKPLNIEQKEIVYIEDHTKKITVDCLDKKETYGEFFGVFSDKFSNKDIYTGIQGGDIHNIKIPEFEEQNDMETINPGLFSTFKQVEDGYSIVLFGYGLSGSGKCLGRNTPILMYDGTIKMVQDVVDGDLVMGDDSRARRVFGITRGRDTMYKVRNVKGESYIVNSEHILSLKYTGKKQLKDRENRHSYQVIWFNKNNIGFDSRTFSYKNRNKAEVYIEAQHFYNNVQDDLYIDIDVQKYLSLSNNFKDSLKGYKVPVEFPHRDVEIDPYMIGYWLGDGNANSCIITTQESSVIKYHQNNLAQYHCYLQFQPSSKYVYRINSTKSSNYFMTILRKYNLLNNKHIPNIYKSNSREQRLKLLAGILDADGSYDKEKRTFEFSQSLEHETIMDDVIYLCQSLGFACYKNKKQTSWTYLGEKKYGEAWRISISGEGIEQIPTLSPRKQALPRRQIKDVLVSGITVEELPEDDYYGFAVDGNHRFLLGNFTVTHNTYTLLGEKNVPGLLHYGLANLNNVANIKLKYLFEQYIDKFVPTINKIRGNIINLIREIPQLKKYSIDETKEFSEYIDNKINVNNIHINDINTLTNLLENYRKNHHRIKKTPNNPVSSRSHLYMVYEILFENGKSGYITVVDTAGRESPLDIYNMFIDTSKRIDLTTILGPTGGSHVVKRYIKSEYSDYDENDVFEILKEGFYINETINHLIYFFNKKNYKSTKIINQTSLEKYNNNKYYVNPKVEEESIDSINNCLMIPILKFLDVISNKQQDTIDYKPTKFICIICVRKDEAYCNQIFDSLAFGNKIKSS